MTNKYLTKLASHPTSTKIDKIFEGHRESLDDINLRAIKRYPFNEISIGDGINSHYLDLNESKREYMIGRDTDLTEVETAKKLLQLSGSKVKVDPRNAINIIDDHDVRSEKNGQKGLVALGTAGSIAAGGLAGAVVGKNFGTPGVVGGAISGGIIAGVGGYAALKNLLHDRILERAEEIKNTREEALKRVIEEYKKK
jgi:hypothetical protein